MSDSNDITPVEPCYGQCGIIALRAENARLCARPNREVSSLPEGEAIFQWPATLSPESVSDIEDWLSLLIKKLK